MSSLMQMLTPDRVVMSAQEVDPQELKVQGITAIITDLDNTLVPWRHYEISPGVVEWLAKLEVEGIKICIASNTLHTERLEQLAKTMGIPFVDRVQKPRTGGFLRAMALMDSTRESTAVYGDQLFTDVLAGNRMGLTTILLRPALSKEEFFSTQMVRYLENFVIRRLEAQGKWPAAQKVADALERLPDPATPAGRRLTAGMLAVVAGIVALIVFLVRKRRGR